MNDYQRPTPKAQPEQPTETRTRRDPHREQPKPLPELSRNPRYVFTDFASI